ncbi:hypothetical protein CON64_17455 [Bacillus pseudomycoides]|nr:hypothetical protein CON64_17455 [Bacillus pseudomycoides]
MKKSFSLFFLLVTFFISGCTNNTYSSVQPYKLTKQEEEIVNLSPIQQSYIHIFEVKLPNNQDAIRATLEYYKDGKKVKDIGAFSASHFENKKVKLSFGQQEFQYESGTREIQQWFINISGRSYKMFEDSLPEKNGSFFVPIREKKKMKYNEKIILGAWVFNTNKTVMSSNSLEDDRSIQHLIQENEHVYTYCIEIKSSDVTK